MNQPHKVSNLVNRIASGEATLLGVEDICKRLGVSRSTFERWVRNGETKMGVLQSKFSGGSVEPEEVLFGSDNRGEGAMTFPPPDIRIGNSPKWEMETFKKWLTANVRSTAK